MSLTNNFSLVCERLLIQMTRPLGKTKRILCGGTDNAEKYSSPTKKNFTCYYIIGSRQTTAKKKKKIIHILYNIKNRSAYHCSVLTVFFTPSDLKRNSNSYFLFHNGLRVRIY